MKTIILFIIIASSIAFAQTDDSVHVSGGNVEIIRTERAALDYYTNNIATVLARLYNEWVEHCARTWTDGQFHRIPTDESRNVFKGRCKDRYGDFESTNDSGFYYDRGKRYKCEQKHHWSSVLVRANPNNFSAFMQWLRKRK